MNCVSKLKSEHVNASRSRNQNESTTNHQQPSELWTLAKRQFHYCFYPFSLYVFPPGSCPLMHCLIPGYFCSDKLLKSFNTPQFILSEKAMASHSSTLAWKIPWTEEPGRLQSMGSQRVGHNWATSLSLFTFMHWRRKWQPTPVFLPGESQGRGSLVGCHLWGRRVGHDWSDLAAAAAVYLVTRAGLLLPP